MMTRTPVDAKGQLLALPVGLSTPVLFLNRDALRQAGINPDTTRSTPGSSCRRPSGASPTPATPAPTPSPNPAA
jgi:maltose-binding protein MalE